MSDALATEDLDRFRLMKEDAAQRAPERGTDDMSGFLEVYRDGKPLLAIFCPDVDRDQLLNAAWYTVAAVGADRILAVMDAHLAKSMENPATGKPWAQGEMQKACHEEGACSTGVITDCLVINDVRRDGTYHMHTITYHIDEAAKEAGDQPVAVHWQPVGDQTQFLGGNEDEKLEGLVPDTLRSAFEREPSDEVKALSKGAEEFGISDEDAKAARDAAAITQLAIQGYGVAVTGDDPVYFERVKGLLDLFKNASAGSLRTEDLSEQASN